MYNNSSRQPVIRMATRAVSPWDVVLAAVAWATILTLWAAGQPFALPPEAPPANPPAPAEAQIDAERTAVWNSPPMLAARDWLDEYFRTSKASSPEAERAYLRRLSQLSAEEMREWMRQFYRKRSDMIAQHNLATQVRRMGVAQANTRNATNYIAARRPLPGYPTGNATPPPSNYVQSRPAPPSFAEPIRAYRYLFYLDTLDIRDDLRALRASH